MQAIACDAACRIFTMEFLWRSLNGNDDFSKPIFPAPLDDLLQGWELSSGQIASSSKVTIERAHAGRAAA
jgi:ABC-type nitrate/sulfonate/bicarbonate transport system permease component